MGAYASADLDFLRHAAMSAVGDLVCAMAEQTDTPAAELGALTQLLFALVSSTRLQKHVTRRRLQIFECAAQAYVSSMQRRLRVLEKNRIKDESGCPLPDPFWRTIGKNYFSEEV